jgi:hypothetical protein
MTKSYPKAPKPLKTLSRLTGRSSTSSPTKENARIRVQLSSAPRLKYKMRKVYKTSSTVVKSLDFTIISVPKEEKTVFFRDHPAPQPL